MRKRVFAYTLAVIAFLILFLVLTFYGTDNHKARPAVLNDVKPFRFTTQDGEPFTEKDLQGKVSVIEYFFTTCKGICPKMNNNMRTVYEALKDEPDFQIVAHTSDPETDSVARLKAYADSMKIDTKKWHLLTGRKDSLYFSARNNYLLDDPKNNFTNINDQFLHTQFFAIVDRHGQVRSQIFDGLKKDEVNLMIEKLKYLLKEDGDGRN